jgi:hypothetical protein
VHSHFRALIDASEAQQSVFQGGDKQVLFASVPEGAADDFEDAT